MRTRTQRFTRQVVKKQVAHGTATFGGSVCDGTPHVASVYVFPDPSVSGSPPSGPFKKATP